MQLAVLHHNCHIREIRERQLNSQCSVPKKRKKYSRSQGRSTLTTKNIPPLNAFKRQILNLCLRNCLAKKNYDEDVTGTHQTDYIPEDGENYVLSNVRTVSTLLENLNI